MNKICVYTCITGNYDYLPPCYHEEGIDYICYTNNKNVKSKDWKIIYIEDQKLNNVKLARKIKILGTEELKKYDVTLWIDGIIDFNTSIKEFIDKYVDLDNYDLIGFKHESRTSINEEIIACYENDKISLDEAIKVQKYYIENKYPDTNQLIESGLLFRNFNNKNLMKCMKIWFDHILNLTHRDQLSFNYAQYLTNIKINLLSINIWDNPYFIAKRHSEIFELLLYSKKGDKFDLKDVKSLMLNNCKGRIEYKVRYDTKSIRLKINTPCGIIMNDLKCDSADSICDLNNYPKYKNNIFVQGPAVFELRGNFLKKGK